MKTTITRALLLLLVLWAGTAQADLQGRLNSYYSSLGGSASVEPAAMYKGQSAGYFSGGGIRIRTPVSNYQIFSMQAPSLKYGCGGIDAFLGGFSFINKEQLIAMARQIGSTAVTTAFYLALDSMSPELSQLMKRLQEWANKANQFNINSCEAGTKMGAALWRNMGGDKSDLCKRFHSGQGVLADEFTAKVACDMDGLDFSWVPGADKNEPGNAVKRMAFGNVVWRALKAAGIQDNELGELVMSVTGTIVVPEGNSKNPQKAHPVPATIGYKEFMDGETNFQILHCNDYDECMNPMPINYSNDKRMATIKQRIENGITWVFQVVNDASGTLDVANCQTCTSNGGAAGDALLMVQLSEYPIFSLLQAERDAGITNDYVANEYKEMLAKEIAFRFFSKVAGPLSSALANDGDAVAGTEATRAQLAEHLRAEVALASQELTKETVKHGGLSAVMEVYMKMKQMASSRYSPSLAQRLKLAQVLRR
jgi:hypothetical protein